MKRASSHAPVIAGMARIVEVTLESLDLTIQKYRVLSHLTRGPASPSQLADRLSVRPPTVTRLVDGLVDRGLVERQPDPSDGRRSVHVLTRKGIDGLAAADAAIAAVIDDIATELAPADRAKAVEGMRLWGDAMRSRWQRTHT